MSLNNIENSMNTQFYTSYQQGIYMKKVKTLALSFAMLASSFANANTLTLQENTLIGSDTLVTLGIPFKPGEIINESSFALFNESGVEVPVFVKPTLTWHFDAENQNSIRAIKVQFRIDSINTLNDQFSWITDATNTLNRITETDINDGLMVSSNELKAGVKHPKVTSVIDPDYLATTKLIPNYYPIRVDQQERYWKSQFNWAKDLDYNNSTLANWLFDRPTSLYKGCMRTGDAICYLEAYTSYNFWMNSLKRDGTYANCKGGSTLAESAMKACDTKYTYIEPLKIHLALTGDDTQFDLDFVNDMAELSRKQFYYQGNYEDSYDSENEHFTERGAGISLLAQINAYELTGEQVILDSINTRITSLYDHLNNNPDNLPKDGTWRHSWMRHEGAAYPGDGDLDDRRFSPWMMENITDALWQAYGLTRDQRIPTMIADSATALLNHGFNDSTGYIDAQGYNLAEQAQKTWASSCNQTKTSVLYSATTVGSTASIITTQDSEGWYSDGHNPEAVLTLALGVHFESDTAKQDALIAQIENIEKGYFNSACGDIKSTPRKFNWNNRSNYWGTYLWVMNERGELPDISNLPADIPINAPAGSPDPTETFTQVEVNYRDSFTDNMNNGLSSVWTQTDGWQINGETLEPISQGFMKWDDSIQIGEEYRVSATIDTEVSTASIGILFNGNGTTFYSARVKSGPWGGVYIYEHDTVFNYGGTLLHSVLAAINLTGNDKVFVIVKDGKAYVGINNVQYAEYELPTVLTNPITGLLSLAANPDYKVIQYSVDYSPISLFTDEFNDNTIYWEDDTSWSASNGELVSLVDSHYYTSPLYLSTRYDVSVDFLDNSSTTGSIGILTGKGLTTGKHYSIRIKEGQWGSIYLYSHEFVYGGGTLEANLSLNIPQSASYSLTTQVNDNGVIDVLLNGELSASFDTGEILSSDSIGLINISGQQAKATSFSFTGY